ncbi:hypothetical protein NL676_038934 [Syzygium grande]|nr:hypothetical protein NL676_038934 [Syzygium grande]
MAQGTEVWTQVNRKKGKGQLNPPSTTPTRQRREAGEEKTRASSTTPGQPLIRNTIGGTHQDLAPGSPKLRTVPKAASKPYNELPKDR